MVKGILFCAAMSALFYGLFFSDYANERNSRMEVERIAREKSEATPHVVQQADGCTVYRFRDSGYWHYFTRCPKTVTTETTLPSGKSTRRDQITTEDSQ